MKGGISMVKLKDLHRGLWFTFKPYDYPKASQVWVKVDYDRSCKKYLCICWDDTSKSRLVSGDREVFTDFTF